MEGQLSKYTNFAKGWQYRWFVLDPVSGMLEYFEKEEHKKQRPRGCIHLAAAVISPSDEDSQTFTVSAANSDVYRLRACDARERQLWVDKIRSAAEHHTASLSSTSLGGRPRRTSSLVHSSNSDLPTSKSKNDLVQSEKSSTAVVPRPPGHKAPAPRPHTLDPFREVKDYILEANDYSVLLNDKINSIPQTDEPIGGLDKDLLLLKATSNATLTSLGQCLKMLQQHSGKQIDWQENQNASLSVEKTGSVRSHTGSVSSTNSVPFVLADEKPDGPIDHDDEVEDSPGAREEELGGVEEHKSVILHLLSQLKLGMDLTKVVLPTFILERRSLLEMFADCMAHPDMFLKIPDLPDPESRMIAVIEWYLTSFHHARQGSVAKKPYNPIIGETFHCSWRLPKRSVNNGLTSSQSGTSVDGATTGSSNGEVDDVTGHTQLVYCAEQVSHHPPVSAFYFECPEKQVWMNASIYTKSRFMGMSIGVNMIGKLRLNLLQHDEEYVFGLPSAYARSILTVPWAEMGDKISITCAKTNYSANCTFHTKPFYGGKLHRISTEIKNGNTGEITCKVQGEWNNTMEFSFTNGENKTIDVADLPVIRKRVRPMKSQGEFESRKLWQHVTNALNAGDVNIATEHKRFLEERQREGERHRKDTGTSFPTKYFRKDGESWIFHKVLEKGNTKGTA
ncbi:hypothetical protein FSP39_006794 [Pinctada imbricata]|uniref:Oxysterol-binding protein n=1 Tax=Pinctada imbricata TaxID=66713 RepID=A0AA89BYX9_PINIB|nr:hypothetical protein FSP39_006794 [Pinctada imbricata]